MVENLQSQKRLLTAELYDAVNKGNMPRRRFILDKLFALDAQIRIESNLKI